MNDMPARKTKSLPRFGTEERKYLLKRAEDHRLLAHAAEESGARAIHLRLQQLYEDRAKVLLMVVRD